MFKRTYDVPNTRDLYVKVLVECNHCGHKDLLNDDYEIEPVEDGLQESIDQHKPCEICGSSDWSERAEHARLGLPAIANDNTRKLKFTTIGEHIDELEDFTEKLEVAKENGFQVRKHLIVERTIVLWKEEK